MTIKSEVALTTLVAFIPTSYASQHSKRLQHFTEYNKIHITLSENKIKSKQSVLAGLVQVYENNLISNHFRWWKSGFCSLWEGRHPSVIETVWFATFSCVHITATSLWHVHILLNIASTFTHSHVATRHQHGHNGALVFGLSSWLTASLHDRNIKDVILQQWKPSYQHGQTEVQATWHPKLDLTASLLSPGQMPPLSPLDTPLTVM